MSSDAPTDYEKIITEFKSKNTAYNSKMERFDKLLNEYKNLKTNGMTGMVGNEEHGYIYGNITGSTGDSTNNTFDKCLTSCQGDTGCYGASFYDLECYKSPTSLLYTDIQSTSGTNSRDEGRRSRRLEFQIGTRMRDHNKKGTGYLVWENSAIVPNRQYYQFKLNKLINKLQKLNDDRTYYYKENILSLNSPNYNDSLSSFSEAKKKLDSLTTTVNNNSENISDINDKQHDSYLTAEQEKTRFQFLLVALCIIMYFTFTYLELSSTIATLFLLLGGVLAFMLVVTQLIY